MLLRVPAHTNNTCKYRFAFAPQRVATVAENRQTVVTSFAPKADEGRRRVVSCRANLRYVQVVRRRFNSSLLMEAGR